MIIRLVTVLAFVGATIAQDDLIVKTSYGSIQGYEGKSVDGTRVRVFKSVPFASPPVGDLRWRLPLEPKGWEGVKDGTKYSAACMSNSTTSSSPQPWVDEDCLYINIWIHGGCSALKKCPIIMYFHGGAMNYDSATYFNDTALVETYASKGVMLVIPGFRLGFTGQFSLGDNQELIPSNLGVYDALHALKFVSKEAVAFGGDSEKISLMGHSGGGALTNLLGFSPIRKRQVAIHQMIVMSSGLNFDTSASTEMLSKEMIKRAGCTNISKKLALSCMKKKTGPELLAIQRKMEEEKDQFGGAIFGGFILRAPLLPFKSMPDFLKNPPNANIMIGTTIGEMDFPPYPKGGLLGSFVGAKNLVELDELYYNLTQSGKNNQTHNPESQAIYIGAFTVARSIMEKGNKAFLYSFDQPTHHMHTDDLSYLMGIHYFERDENEKLIEQFYPQLFLNFTKFGEPSPNWKPLNLKDRYYSIAVNLTIGRMPEMHNHYEKETIDFWVRKAPKIDKIITVTRAAGAKMEWDKVTGGFRDLTLEEEDQSPVKNETLIPVLLVHASYFPSFLLVCSVFLLGLVIGRYLFNDSTSNEERMWILGPDGRGMRIDQGKAPAYAEQMF
ncbi:hypothetical protein PENTCL1PPCAC_26380 [Pristionchus entomophagus]|uniref:Carboxylic ester hydrolase n=1 Tax=Pristionchus entomophagus TaxID=358040 RepID=A0AAV5UCR1_9BILA|nr:hypothetical protein PENTCL1PPCAC_26380 [Pristionchus entomophagus]